MFKPFGKNYTYTEAELDEMGEILLTANDIREDDKLMRLVQKHMDEKSDKITKIQDLRDLQAEGDSPKKVM